MQRYKEFSPSAFDGHINFDDDREDWFVVPVIQTRDSEALDRCNLISALEILGGEQEDLVEIHRFGHWGPGWFELILIHPSLKEKGKLIEAALSNYPVLDDDKFCQMEEDERLEDWQNWAGREFVRRLKGTFILQDETVEFLEKNEEALYSYHMDWSPYNDLDFRYILNSQTPNRNDIAKMIREIRKQNKDAARNH